MRNPGGFSLPPRVPQDECEFRRAIELLGARTQRANMSDIVAMELYGLIGGYPTTREMAQQWKGALRLYKRKTEGPTAPERHRIEIKTRHMSRIRLPERRSQVERVFMALDRIRIRFEGNEPPPESEVAVVRNLLGYEPTSEADLRRTHAALQKLQRQRRSEERIPPRVPWKADELARANMLLGTAARLNVPLNEASGQVLQDLLGAKPRCKATARRWHKHLKIQVRKRKKARAAAERLCVANEKRVQRRAKKARAAVAPDSVTREGPGNGPSAQPS